MQVDGLVVASYKYASMLVHQWCSSDATLVFLSTVWMYGGRLVCFFVIVAFIVPATRLGYDPYMMQRAHDEIARKSGTWQDVYHPTMREKMALHAVGGKAVIDRQPFRYMPVEEIEYFFITNLNTKT